MKLKIKSNILKSKNEYKYFIKKEIKKIPEDKESKPKTEIHYTPMVKVPGMFSRFQQIAEVKGYEELFLYDFSGTSNLTPEECMEIIRKHKIQVENNLPIEIQYERIK